jgi:hypothetical protein
MTIEQAKKKAVAAYKKREVGTGKMTPFEEVLCAVGTKTFEKGWDAVNALRK